jgi:long-chain fatty acid transport protein
VGPDAQSTSAFGVIFGATAAPMTNMTVGVSYSLKNTYTYKGVIDLGALNASPSGVKDIPAGDPSVLNAGVAYKMADWKFAVDYSRIFWTKSVAEGEELGWTDQGIIGAGTEYSRGDWAFRMGFNYGKSPIDTTETTPGTISGVPATKQTITLMNLAAFPAIAEAHLSAGAGYKFSPGLNADLAFVYSFSKTLARTGSGVNPGTVTSGTYTYTAKVSQWAIAAGLGYQF